MSIHIVPTYYGYYLLRMEAGLVLQYEIDESRTTPGASPKKYEIRTISRVTQPYLVYSTCGVVVGRMGRINQAS